MKQLPYGISDFKRIRRDDLYYVDKTMYLPLLEEENSYLLMIRPRRFGKSLFLSMMEAYYDVNMKDRFQELFGGLWIGKNPTRLANKFQVMRFDFSRARGSIDNLESKFNEYCSRQLNRFIEKYKEFYDDFTYRQVLEAKSAESKLNIIEGYAHDMELSLYLIIDEYDNFTNNVLASHGSEVFGNLTHTDGFYRNFFKLFKGMFERIFMIGISPVTLDDLTSGYNIDWNISNLPDFNSMLGFEEKDVRQMLAYYKDCGRVDGEIDDIIADMKPWYDNYCFSLKKHGRETVYNCDMALYYMSPLLKTGLPPEDMIDKNIKTDFSKLQMLINLDHGIRRETRISAIEQIANEGFIDMKLKTSFPAMELLQEDNFLSLVYYYGLLTIDGGEYPISHMVIPNECVRQQYWNFMINMYENVHPIAKKPIEKDYRSMVYNGEWRPVIEKIGEAFKELSSVRDTIGGEHNVQGFFKAWLGVCDYALLCPEMELNYGYNDFVLVPLRSHYPNATHCYIFELKYARKDASEKEVADKYDEAEAQIETYAASPRLLRAIDGCTLHGITILFRGLTMDPPRVIIEKKITL
ncbi:MAG: ATP-binding protein [Bacteroidales bacterium]|nr:ATP-binding protein [Bacteroidales bacterium]